LTVALRASVLLCWVLVIGCSLDPGQRNPVEAIGGPLVPSGAIETVVELDEPPGNVTVTPDGRVSFTFHPEAKPGIHVAEVAPDGEIEPFPDAAWQAERDDAPYFVTPLALRTDRSGRLWVLDRSRSSRARRLIRSYPIPRPPGP
jgi:hypothetical protein